jgi:hypothetical protein
MPILLIGCVAALLFLSLVPALIDRAGFGLGVLKTQTIILLNRCLLDGFEFTFQAREFGGVGPSPLTKRAAVLKA